MIDDETGRPLLTDFGIARPQTGGETLTETGTVVGTPHYMSPEQAIGQRELDGRSDLYSLAVVGYQMLTGSLPFAASSAQDLLRQLVTQAPTPIEWLKPDIAPHLAATITRCLAKSPSDRCSDGRAFREAVTQVGVELDELAEDSAALEARWVWIVASEIALAYLAWGVWAANDFRGLPGAGIFVVVALGLPLLFLTQALVRIYEGGQPGAVLRAFLRQPAWWSFWYPRRLRRRDDVWEQLPPGAKRLNAFGAFLFVASGVVVPFAIGAMLSPSLAASLGYGLIAPLVGVSAAIVYVLLAIDRFGRGLGLSSPVAQRLVLGPRSPALLRRPEVAQLLAGGAIATDESTTGPRAATEYVQEIGERARMLSGPARALGVQATAAARSLHAAMRALDADLESAVAPSEIEARVRELGEESEDEPSDRRLLRQFLRTQLAEARQAQQRQGGVAARRAELLDLLKNLHRMTQQLGRVSPEAVAGGELEERLRVVLRLAEKVGAPGPGDRSAS